MANPTSNYGWVLPNSTDLVTDLPADFDVALQGVDTTTKALNPSTTLGDIEYRSATANTNTRLPIGTTGQVLTVVGGVPAWSSETGDISSVTAGTGISGGGTSGAVTITNDMATTITTAGDLIKGTGSGTYARLGIGSTGQVLTVSGGAPVWSTPASSGSLTLLSTTDMSGLATSGPSITGISGSYGNLLIIVQNARFNGDHNVEFSFNTAGAQYIANYGSNGTGGTSSYSGNGSSTYARPAGDSIVGGDTSSKVTNVAILMNRYASSDTSKAFTFGGGFYNANYGGNAACSGAGRIQTSSALTSFQFRTVAQTGSWSSGTIYIYGVN